MQINGMQYIIAGAAGIVFISAFVWYSLKSWKRWIVILDNAFRYHMDSINVIANEGELSTRSRDAFRILTWILKKQMPADVKSGLLGFRGLLYSQSAIQTAWNAFFDLSGNSHGLDMRLLRLLNTLISTLYSYYLLHSVVRWAVLPILDIRLLLSKTGRRKTGAIALFRDIELTIRSRHRES
ncbi:MAG TPA: hypothetical protein PK200_18230 [Spirochaetota bacterium]|nr:hypothetical protein [Spirochaetota bacterium]